VSAIDDDGAYEIIFNLDVTDNVDFSDNAQVTTSVGNYLS